MGRVQQLTGVIGWSMFSGLSLAETRTGLLDRSAIAHDPDLSCRALTQ